MSMMDGSEAMGLSGSHARLLCSSFLQVMEGGHILYFPNRGTSKSERGLYEQLCCENRRKLRWVVTPGVRSLDITHRYYNFLFFSIQHEGCSISFAPYVTIKFIKSIQSRGLKRTS